MSTDIPDFKHISFVFFGSGPVAAESLKLLAESFNIEAVVTKPQPAHHKASFPVIETAKDLHIPIHTVTNKAELSLLINTKPFSAKLGVLIDFGIIVNQDVIDYFPLGIVNSHFSILPEWRGADPISFAILSGQQTTGVSSMLLVEGMDEGPLLSYGEEQIKAEDTTPELTKRLINLSNGLLLHDVPTLIKEGVALGMPQDITGREVSYSRKLTKADGLIDWTKPADVIQREIRAFIEWPKSTTNIGGKDIVVTSAHVVDKTGEPGVMRADNSDLTVFCGEKALIIDSLKPAGKNEMSSVAFLAGYSHLLNY